MPVMPLRDIPTPDELSALVACSPTAVWLDSASDGRYSLVGLEPAGTLSYQDGCAVVKSIAGEVKSHGQPLTLLRSLLQETSASESVGSVPFMGGAVGYFSYDLGRSIERIPSQAANDRHIPDLMLNFYTDTLLIDHQLNYAAIVGIDGFSGSTMQHWCSSSFQERCQRWLARLNRQHKLDLPSLRRPQRVTWSYTPKRYREAVEQALAYIVAGDIYQVNLAQRLSIWPPPDPLSLYRYLRRVNPEPYAAFVQYPGLALVGASPEEFLVVRGRDVTTKPIKGTRRRGKDSTEDAALAQELAESEKDAAELVMIVDLERNDLGRVAEVGSVHVTKLAEIEAHPHVFHRVATVAARLRSEIDAASLLQATFPGGSITGAPKIRAMQIIEELEPVRRGPYTGSVGYISATGDFGLNIAIRTVVVTEAGADIYVGGGIVADSKPDLEYDETLAKAAGLLKAWNLKPEDVVPLTDDLNTREFQKP